MELSYLFKKIINISITNIKIYNNKLQLNALKLYQIQFALIYPLEKKETSLNIQKVDLYLYNNPW